MQAAFTTVIEKILLTTAIGFPILLAPSLAQAHFTLDYPPEWTVDSDSSGDPQKAFPCGVLSTDTYMTSGLMTSFAPGQKITVKWTEVIPHDGWFRIALSYQNGAEFQATTDFPEPTYETDNTSSALGGPYSLDASIEAPPVPPVLMDDIDPHTAASVSVPMQYSQDITLPTMTCDKCVLQVIQIMLNHPVNPPNNVPGAAYTYHHCAFISITPNGDGGTQAVLDAGSPPGTGGADAGPQDATLGSGSGGSGSGSGSGSTGSSGGASSGTSTSSGASSSSGSNRGSVPSSGGGTNSSSGSAPSGGSTPAGSAGPTSTSGGPSSSGNSSNNSGGCAVSSSATPSPAGAAGLAGLAFIAAFRRRRSRS